MAIDSAEKRRSAGAVLVIFIPGVTADATKAAEWRQQSGWGYSGIAVGAEEGTGYIAPVKKAALVKAKGRLGRVRIKRR